MTVQFYNGDFKKISVKKDLKFLKNICKEVFKTDDLKGNFTDLRCCFNDLIDSLQKDDLISDKTRQNAYLTKSKLDLIYINCLSCKVRIF